jgi:hypothetical protein
VSPSSLSSQSSRYSQMISEATGIFQIRLEVAIETLSEDLQLR